MQKVDLKNDYDHEMLSFRGYNLLIENNTIKARCGIYVKNNLKFARKVELEGNGGGIIIIDLDLMKNYRIINVYRVFQQTD